jgi:hypothetical protein
MPQKRIRKIVPAHRIKNSRGCDKRTLERAAAHVIVMTRSRDSFLIAIR